jgi:hypothetical protein
MTLQRAEVVHTSIALAPREVIAFLSDVGRWRSWAPWIQSVQKTTDRQWTLRTDAGMMTVTFVDAVGTGVLDHEVALESGLTAFNAMRIVPNGTATELVMVLFQQPSVSSADFERDVEAVRADLARIKLSAEASAMPGSS